MSDSLKDRLTSHSGAFEGLLSLIPAKYYYEDDAKTQLKGSKANGRSKASEETHAKEPDADAEIGSSALDELKRREGNAPSAEDAEEDEDVPIYDDHGNQISGPKELSIQEILRAKARGEMPFAETANGSETSKRPTEHKEPTKPKQASNKRKKTEAAPVAAPQAEPTKAEVERGSLQASPAANSESQSADAGADAGAAREQGSLNAAATESGSQEAREKPSVENKKGIAELRAKLAARISEMRTKRKAPGSSAPGAPKNREELLAQRKLRQEQKQKNQSLKRKRNGDEGSDDEGQGDELADGVHGRSKVDEHLMFGQVQFNDGARLARDLEHIEEQKRVKKRNAIDQLRVIESRKAKMDELAEDKKKQVAENAKWSRAILQSEGAKIRDDEKLLRKTLRNKERQKSKSAKAWRDRKETVTNDIAAREAKRTANIKAHREAKQLRLKGKKRKEHMKRAGFEGKRR